MNALNDTEILELSKSIKETGNICDCLWHLSRPGLNPIFQMAKPMQMFLRGFGKVPLASHKGPEGSGQSNSELVLFYIPICQPQYLARNLFFGRHCKSFSHCAHKAVVI